MIFPAATPPPPAYVVTAMGLRALARSSYCWKTTCADYIPPRCGDGRTPSIRVRRGEIVRFRLGFEAKEVAIRVGALSATFVPLSPTPPLRWKITRGGVMLLSTRAKAGSASYSACLRLR